MNRISYCLLPFLRVGAHAFILENKETIKVSRLVKKSISRRNETFWGSSIKSRMFFDKVNIFWNIICLKEWVFFFKGFLLGENMNKKLHNHE